MNSFIINNLKNDAKLRFIQISDIHLINDINGKFLGINPLKSYLDIINEILQSNFDPNFLVVTGDIAQDDSEFVYNLFKDHAKDLNIPVFWIPGNHDFPQHINNILNQEFFNVKPNKHLILNNKWQIVLLGSQHENNVSGLLSSKELDFLESCLNKYPDLYTIIGLHHHLYPIGSAWIDQHNLKNTEQLIQVLNKHNNIKFIMHGHIHQEQNIQHNGYKIYSSPATSIQFMPKKDKFTLDKIQPGWREYILENNGNFTTTVKRLTNSEYIPDFNSKGY